MDLPERRDARRTLVYAIVKTIYYFLSDTVNSAGTSFNYQILGLYPSADFMAL
jgi:hypothetical protein